METVLITGATGLIGTKLVSLLEKEGYRVKILSRSKTSNGKNIYSWDVDRQHIDLEALEDVDHIIHLAGARIADKRWNKQRKQVLYDSRIKSALLLRSALKEAGHKIMTFIGASAIGYYGDRGNVWLYEEQDPGKDFLANLCIDWEKQSEKFIELSERVVVLRFGGVVLSKEGGALPEMEKGIKLGVAAYLGNGKQYVSWIHIDDLCRIIIQAIKDNTMEGTYNAVTPNPVPNKTFIKSIAKAKGMHTLPVSTPAFVLKLVLGELSTVVLGSQRCSAEKLIHAGYEFQYPKIGLALKEIYET